MQIHCGLNRKNKKYATKSAFIIISSSILFLFLSTGAFAGKLNVLPIKIVIDVQKKNAVLRVTNEGNEKVTVQLEAVEWSQDEGGNDRYNPTKDIIFFPKIAGIDKGEERIIRVGFQGKPGALEKTYRLFIEELPVSKPGETAVKFLVRMGIPIFIRPLKEMKEISVDPPRFSGGVLDIKVNNNGNTHFIVSKIQATGIDKSGKEVFSVDMAGWYLLAGISKTYSVNIPDEKCLKTERVKFGVEIDKEVSEKYLDSIDTALCSKQFPHSVGKRASGQSEAPGK